MSLTSLILISLKKDDGGGGVKSAVKIVYTLREKIKIYKKISLTMTILFTHKHDFKNAKNTHVCMYQREAAIFFI